MKKLALFILLPGVAFALCDEGFEQVGEKCLMFQTEFRLTFPEAHEFCREQRGATLALIDSARHFKAIVDHIINNEMKESFWIDGTDSGHEGQWTSREGQDFPMGTPFWAGFPDYQEPNGGTRENCAQINNGQSFYINDLDCHSAFWFICEQASNDDKYYKNESAPEFVCPRHYIALGDKCISFLNEYSVPWSEASLRCGDLEYPGELAIVDDIELLRKISVYLNEEWLTDHDYWLGGFDEGHEGLWTWTDGSGVPMGTPFWGLGSSGQEPDRGSEENYLAIIGHGRFYFRDVAGSANLHPICQLIE